MLVILDQKTTFQLKNFEKAWLGIQEKDSQNHLYSDRLFREKKPPLPFCPCESSLEYFTLTNYTCLIMRLYNRRENWQLLTKIRVPKLLSVTFWPHWKSYRKFAKMLRFTVELKIIRELGAGAFGRALLVKVPVRKHFPIWSVPCV